jgi:hypothetical protein
MFGRHVCGQIELMKKKEKNIKVSLTLCQQIDEFGGIIVNNFFESFKHF